MCSQSVGAVPRRTRPQGGRLAGSSARPPSGGSARWETPRTPVAATFGSGGKDRPYALRVRSLSTFDRFGREGSPLRALVSLAVDLRLKLSHEETGPQ